MRSAANLLSLKEKKTRSYLSLALALSLGACANLGVGGQQQRSGPTLQERVAALEVMVAEYERELSRLEVRSENNSEAMADMAADIQALETIGTRLSRLEVQVRARNAEESHVAPPEQTQSQANMATTENGGFAVHLASYRSRETAVEGWNDMVAKYPAEMGSLKGVMSIFDVPSLGGRFFRLKAGPFRTEENAQNFCSVLEALNEYCVVDLYDGEIISN